MRRLDLDYMHARYFSAHLGRFHSVDPVGAAPGWPQSWNRYTYVLGNPMKYTDPEGLQQFEVFDQIDVTAQPFAFPTDSLSITLSVLGLLSGPSSSNSFGFALFGATGNPQATPQWVNPTGGCIRGCDSKGCGGFGATRRRGGKRGIHEGTDFLATSGQDVFAPTSGTLTRPVNRVYANDPRYTGFVLSGHNGFTMKAFYVGTDPSLIGAQVTAGDILGTAQDLTVKYPGISNHVHLEIRDSRGQLIDPATLIPTPPGCP